MKKKIKHDEVFLCFIFFVFYGCYFYKYFVEIYLLWYNLSSMTISPKFVLPQQINGMQNN